MANDELLNGWKEIANFLNRGVRTAQRWERLLQMPVRRPSGRGRSAVIGLRTELQEWLSRTPLGLRESECSTPRDSSVVSAKVLVVEDSVKDLNTCVNILRSMGIAQLDAISNVAAALLRLEEIASGKLSKPDVIILDLAFPAESGFEILRLRNCIGALQSIPVVVWTAMAYAENQLSTTFGVHRVVPKGSRAAELEHAVRDAVAA